MVLECVCCRVMSVDMLVECRARQSSVVSVREVVWWGGQGGGCLWCFNTQILQSYRSLKFCSEHLNTHMHTTCAHYHRWCVCERVPQLL